MCIRDSCNIVLDYLLVARLDMGIQGAAAATILGLLLSFCMGIFYFCLLYTSG